MATYYTKSCPLCGYKYQIHSLVKKQYGSPIRKCSQCNKQFVDTDFLEIALLPQRKRRTYRVSLLAIFHAIIWGILTLLVWDTSSLVNNLVTTIPLGMSIIWIISDICGYRGRCLELDKELQNSRIRLSDPEYIRLLHEIDYELLPKSLRKTYPRIVHNGSVNKKQIYKQLLIAVLISGFIIAGLVVLVLSTI